MQSFQEMQLCVMSGERERKRCYHKLWPVFENDNHHHTSTCMSVSEAESMYVPCASWSGSKERRYCVKYESAIKGLTFRKRTTRNQCFNLFSSFGASAKNFLDFLFPSLVALSLLVPARYALSYSVQNRLDDSLSSHSMPAPFPTFSGRYWSNRSFSVWSPHSVMANPSRYRLNLLPDMF